MNPMTSLGLVLLVLGAVMAIAEAHNPTHGVVGGAGVTAMAVGAVLAISGIGAGLLLGLLVGVGLAGAGAGALLISLRRGMEARQRRVRTGAEGIIGHIGVVRNWTDATGSVALDGAVWHARRSACPEPEDAIGPLSAGDPVVVEKLNGLTLSVRPAEEWELL
jgi:membrane-bound ClpP family serine protease